MDGTVRGRGRNSHDNMLVPPSPIDSWNRGTVPGKRALTLSPIFGYFDRIHVPRE